LGRPHQAGGLWKNNTSWSKIQIASIRYPLQHRRWSVDTFSSINRLIEEENLPGGTQPTPGRQTGCIGLCALEPIVQVQFGDQTPVTYGKVTPEVAYLILKNHIGKGLVVQEYVVDNI
jgi:(2Fe-2S) ferredoxin